jgi:cell wall assembly regulator SMI1
MFQPDQFHSFLVSQGFTPPQAGIQLPVSDEAIGWAESTMGCEFADDVKALYRYSKDPFNGWTIGNGSEVPPLIGGRFRFLAWELVVQYWQMHMVVTDQLLSEHESFRLQHEEARPEPVDRLLPGCFRPGWIPIGASLGGVTLHADHSPGPAGVVGQLVSYTTEDGDMRGRWVARGIGDYLGRWMVAVDNGSLRVVEGDWFLTQSNRRLSLIESVDEAFSDA